MIYLCKARLINIWQVHILIWSKDVHIDISQNLYNDIILNLKLIFFTITTQVYNHWVSSFLLLKNIHTKQYLVPQFNSYWDTLGLLNVHLLKAWLNACLVSFLGSDFQQREPRMYQGLSGICKENYKVFHSLQSITRLYYGFQQLTIAGKMSKCELTPDILKTIFHLIANICPKYRLNVHKMI